MCADTTDGTDGPARLESSVIATRWKRGKKRGRIELLRDASRGPDGRPRAPAKFLGPELPKKNREATLRDGFPLVEPVATPSTGDAELDKLLEDFDEAVATGDEAEEDDDFVYVDVETSVRAIGAAIGMTEPMLHPYDDKDARVVLFTRMR